jgi:hypothetical protein
MPIVGQFGSLAGFGMFPGGALESIATVTVGSGGASSIEFTSIPGTYQHLQIRVLAKHSSTGNVQTGRIQFNGSTAANYAAHVLSGSGSAASANALTSTSDPWALTLPSTDHTSIFGASIIDILDYGSTSKATTYRALTGGDTNGGGFLQMFSGLWTTTDAISSIKLYYPSANLAQHSSAALYGVRA